MVGRILSLLKSALVGCVVVTLLLVSPYPLPRAKAADSLAITSDGTYTLPAGFSGLITIQAGLTSVTLVGNEQHIDTSVEILGPTTGLQLTINNLSIVAPGGRHGITIGTGSYALNLVCTNTIVGGYGGAGVHIPPGASVVIASSATPVGSLAASGNRGAGIGGGEGSGSGSITINGGNITAVGATGIGGGDGGAGGATTINGGTVTASSVSSLGAAIGGGYLGGAGTIAIHGGTVSASAESGCGIGSGYSGIGGSITITSGVVTATGGSSNAGIGNANRGSGVNVTISGGVVTAKGGDPPTSTTSAGGAGIGGGRDGSSGIITISGGVVTATGGRWSAGIGTGVGATGGTINISNGTVTATGWHYGAGIGSGSGNDSARGTISINISGGNITATSPNYAPGIGDGYQSPDVTFVKVTGGTVIATASSSMRDIGYASGISSAGPISLIDGSGVNLTYVRVTVRGSKSAPLSGATVTLNGVTQATNSNGHAGFFLPTSGSSSTISVSAPHYETEVVDFTPSEQSIRQNLVLLGLPCSVTYSAGPNGGVKGPDGIAASAVHQTTRYGEDGPEVEAIPDPHYHFVRWSDGVTTAVRRDLNISGDMSVTAEFERNIELHIAPDALTKTYGDPDPLLSYTITVGSLQDGDSLTGVLGRALGQDVGSYAIVIGSLVAGPRYDIVLLPQDFAITPRPITITADNKQKVYGEANPELTYQITSGALETGDSVTGSLIRESGEDVGTYAIEQGTVGLSSNYDLTFIPGHLTIAKRALTITANNASKTYDGNPYTQFSVSYAGLAFGESSADLGGTLQFVGEATTAVDAGSYTVTPSGYSSDNYDITYVSGQLTIQKATLSVSGSSHSKVYDGQVFAGFDALYSGFVNGEDISVLTGTLVFGETATTAFNVGHYTCEMSGLSSSNYNIVYVPGDLRILARPLIITAEDKAKVYDGTVFSPFSAIYDGFAEGENEASLGGTLRFAGAATEATGAGSYPITPWGLSSANYSIEYVAGELIINRRPVTVTASDSSKTYGEADPVFSYAVTSGSLVSGDSFSGSLSRIAGENVGSYEMTLGSLTAGSNYDVSLIPADLIITRRPITVTAHSFTKTYGELDPELTCTVSTGSLAGSDALTGALERVPGQGVGTYTIGQGSLAAGGNYDLDFIGGSLSIEQRPITVTAQGLTKIYGEPDPELTFDIASGSLVGSDTLSGTLGREPGQAVGTYTIDVGTLTAGPNYSLTFVGSELIVIPRLITVTADTLTKVYGASDPELTYTITSGQLLCGDTLAGALSRVAGESVDIYAINQGTLDAGANYTLTFSEGSLSVTPRALTIFVDNKQKTYDATAFSDFTITLSGFTPGEDESHLSGTLEFSGDALTAINVGDYEAAASGLTSENYNITYVPGTLTIAKRPLTITAVPLRKDEGSPDPVLTYSLTSGSLVGEDTFTGSPERAAGEDGGRYRINIGTLTAGPNYEITFIPAYLTIHVDVPILPIPQRAPSPHSVAVTAADGELASLPITAERITTPEGQMLERLTLTLDDIGYLRQGYPGEQLLVTFRNTAPDPAGKQPMVEFALTEGALLNAADLSIVLASEHGSIYLPSSLVQQLAVEGQGLSVQVSREPVSTLAKDLPAATEAVGDALVVRTTLLGNTTVAMTVSMPLPEGKEEQDAYLGSLSIFALHSSGDKENIFDLKFDIDNSGPKPILRHISFEIDSFSKFVVLRTTSQPLNTVVGTAGYSVNGLYREMVPCYYKGSDTLMPIRMLQDFGVNFTWNETTKSATMTFRHQTVVLTIGSTDAYINGVKVPIIGASGQLIAPELAPGRTMIPLRFVSEHLGFTVHWDPSHLITFTLPR